MFVMQFFILFFSLLSWSVVYMVLSRSCDWLIFFLTSITCDWSGLTSGTGNHGWYCYKPIMIAAVQIVFEVHFMFLLISEVLRLNIFITWHIFPISIFIFVICNAMFWPIYSFSLLQIDVSSGGLLEVS